MRNQDKYNTNNVKAILEEDGFFLMDEYIDAKTKMLCKDSEGYFIYIVFSNYLTRHGIGRRFDKSNIRWQRNGHKRMGYRICDAFSIR